MDGADLDLVRLGHDPEVAELGDGPARGQRGQPGAPAALDGAVHLVAVQVVGAAAAAGADALGQQVGDVLEVRAGQVAERRRLPGQAEQLVLGPRLGGRLGHHLLRQDVQRLFRHDQGVQLAAAHAAQQRGAFHQLVPGGRVDPAGRRPGPGVVGPADPLQEGGEAARRADLADQLDRPDVDAELERGRGHQGPQVPGPQPGLDPLPAAPRQRPVVRGDVFPEFLAEPFAELVGDPLGHAPGVDEDQGGPVAGDVGRDQVQDLRHLIRGGDRAEFVVGHLQGQVQPPAVPGVHDRAARRPVRVVAVRSGPDQQPGHRLDRPLGGGQADPLDRLLRHVGQSFQGQGQVGASLVRRDRVDLVHDDGAHAAQHGPAPLGRHHEVERLRRGDQDVRRPLEHGGPLGRDRVTGPDRDPDVRRGQPELGGGRGDPGQRRLQVLLDVGGQRLQRRHVHDLRPARTGCGRFSFRWRCPPAFGGLGIGLDIVPAEQVVGAALVPVTVEAVDADQEGRQRLARAGRRRDQRVAPGCDLPPPAGLRLGRPIGKAALEPAAHGGMERLEHAPHATWGFRHSARRRERAGASPGSGGWAVAGEDLGSVLVPGGGGAVGVEDDGPAPAVDDDLVVEGAEQYAVLH